MNQKELHQALVEDLRTLANHLEALMNFEKVTPAPKKKKVAPKVTLEEVRQVLARKSQEGFTAEIKSIIQRFGVEKLSDINPSDYEEVLLSAEELTHD